MQFFTQFFMMLPMLLSKMHHFMKQQLEKLVFMNLFVFLENFILITVQLFNYFKHYFKPLIVLQSFAS